MKKILVTGASSYIGTAFKNYMQSKADEYQVDGISVRGSEWKNTSFAEYDAIYHVAGLAHIKETKENSKLYFDINRDVAVEVARKAKSDGVGQFILMSTMSVYGIDTGLVNSATLPAPKNSYGKSKLQAEELISALEDESFKVCILRPPMVYGQGCKGNFQTVVKLVEKLPFFPKLDNKRSMIHVDNLSEFVRLAVDKELSGVYFPQNREYMNTSDMAMWLGKAKGKNLFMSRFIGVCVKMIKPFSRMARKAFGSLIYADTEQFGWSYCVRENEESVMSSVK